MALHCAVCGARDTTLHHIDACEWADTNRRLAWAHGNEAGIPPVTTDDLWAHMSGHPEDATRIVRLVIDLGWRPVVGSDKDRLWTKETE